MAQHSTTGGDHSGASAQRCGGTTSTFKAGGEEVLKTARRITRRNGESGVGMSMVLPAYNEEVSITAAIRGGVEALRSVTDHFDIIFINDGSRDDTVNAVRSLMPG